MPTPTRGAVPTVDEPTVDTTASKPPKKPAAKATSKATSRAAATTTTTTTTPALDTTQLDQSVTAVAKRADAWANTDPIARAELLERLIRDTMAAAPAWLDDATRAKGLTPKSPEAGEELFAGIGTFVRMARLLKDSLHDIAKTGRPNYPGPVSTAPDGRLKVGVFPIVPIERVLFARTTGEVWMPPGVTHADVDNNQALAYKDPQKHKGTSLVLGAGNVGSLGPRDVLTKLFVEGKVVVLKANPVNDYLVPHWSRAFAGLIAADFVRIVRGGGEEGAYLTNHPLIDEVHITGSDKTHDIIVFGAGPDGERRKAGNQPLLTKPVTSELGNVSPVIIVPGEWSAADLRYQAAHVATMLANNAGFNCLTVRVIVTHAGWPQRQAFLNALADALGRIATRRAYYPGARQRYDAFTADHDVLRIGDTGPASGSTSAGDPGNLPWTIIRDVDPSATDDICFNAEAFCSLTAETAVPANSSAAFIGAAVELCNEVLWGTLSATMLVHPKSRRDPAVAAAVDQAVADLRYGGIGVNIWHGLVFALSSTTWGAYPGHPVNDIESGAGVVGNAFMFDRPQKSVVTAPFRNFPIPPWFATHRREYAVMQHLVRFEADQSMRHLPGLLFAAMRP